MDRTMFIDQVLESCELYRYDILGQYVKYYLLGISDNLVRVEMRYFDEYSEVCTTLEFQNDDKLIDAAENEVITLKGKVIGFDELLEEIKLNQCIFIQK